ncbi:MAG: hypothetical protein AABP62_29260, partial [Planctomycetota bacterium]
MNVSSWLWDWLDIRRDVQPSQDPLDHAAKLSLRKLEDRQVLSVTSVFTAGLLDIDLSSGDDITLQVIGGTVQESINGGAFHDIDADNNLSGIQTVSASDVMAISVHSADGGDNAIDLSGVSFASGFTHAGGVTVSIDAGDGADAVMGSAFADTILGGLGNDSLQGGAGNDSYLFFDTFGVDT